ncbi:hypothetical protein IJT93_00085 [bacterium]|nr:hypothetical protein [bacterium]
MKKAIFYLSSALAFGSLLFLPCHAQTPQYQNSAPAAKMVKRQTVCSIHNIRLGMSENEVEDILGSPCYKSGRDTVWHYRHIFNTSEGKSDPQIKFADGRVISVIGSALNLNGHTVLMDHDDEQRIQKALGPCPEIRKGANNKLTIYVYYQYHLEIVTKNQKIEVMNLEAK